MPASEQPRNPALAYWPQIEYAAAAGLTTADLWGIIGDAAAELGLATPGVSAIDVSRLRGVAGGIQNAARILDATPDERALESRMFAQAPWSRPLAQQNAAPEYHVRYQHTVINSAGEEETIWHTSRFVGRYPATLAELREAVNEDAEQIADKYGAEHVGVAGLQLLAV